jgi:hypothetical protein
MKIRLAILLLLFSGCASRQFTVTLFRSGGASSITERYSVNQDGIGTKLVNIPLDSESKKWTYSVDSKLLLALRGLMTDSLQTLSKIEMRDTTGAIVPAGELMSGITIDAERMHKEITWPNLDPPNRQFPAFDSLYSIMLRVESNMVSL